jgi:hypothetical protein
MARLFTFKGSSGVELQGIVLGYDAKGNTSINPLPVPKGGMIAQLVIEWAQQANLQNFIASLSGVPNNSGATATAQTLIVIPGPGKVNLSYVAVPSKDTEGPAQGFSVFLGKDFPSVPIPDQDASRPTLTVLLPFLTSANSVQTVGLRFFNAVPIAQALQVSADNFLTIGTIGFVFDEIAYTTSLN